MADTNPFSQFSESPTPASTSSSGGDNPFAQFAQSEADSQTTTDDSASKGGFLEGIGSSQFLQGLVSAKDQGTQEVKSGHVLKGAADILTAAPRSAWNLLEGNQFANDARTAAGVSNYDVDISTLTDELMDTNARMARLAKTRGSWDEGSSRLYDELQTRQQAYTQSLDQLRDGVNQKHQYWESLKKGVTDTAKNFVSNPSQESGQLLGGLLDSAVSDPELMVSGGEASAISKISAATNISTRAANFGIDLANNKWVRGSLNGAAMIAPMDMAQQLNEKSYIDLGQTGTTMVSGMLLGVFSKGVFNNVEAEAIQSKVRSAMGSGKDALGKVVSDLSGNPEAIEAAKAAGEAGGDYSVDSLIPEDIELKTDKAYADIERLANEPVSASKIKVRAQDMPEQIDIGRTASPYVVQAMEKLGSIPLEYNTVHPGGIDATEVPGEVENLTMSDESKLRSGRAFGKEGPVGPRAFGTEPPRITVSGNDFTADILDDDGFKMGDVRGRVNPNTITPLVGTPAARDMAMFPNAVNRAWENLIKYSISSGRQFTTFSRLDAGKVDFFNDLKSKGYNVVENPNWAWDYKTNDRVATDGEPLYKVTGKAGGAGVTELVEAHKDLQTAYTSYMKTQGGYVKDPRMLVPVALFGLGFAYGYKQQNSIMQAFKDGAETAALTLVPAALSAVKPVGRGIVDGIRGIGKAHYTLGTIGEDFNNSIQQGIPYKAYVLKNAINSVLGKTENHHDTFMYLQGDKSVKLTPEEQKIADAVHQVTRQAGVLGLQHGILEDSMNEFFSRWLKPGPNAPEEAKANWGKYKPWTARKYPQGIEGFNQAMKDGFEPVTENVGDIMQNYVTTMWRAIELRKFTDAAKEHILSDGTKAVLPTDKSPRDWVPLQGTLYGYSGHPDIAKDLNFLLDFPKFSDLGKAYDFVNYGMKRGQLNLALFHPGQLAKNYTFANLGSAIAEADPARAASVLKGFAGSVNPNSEIHQMIRGGDETVQDAIKHGVTFSLGRTTEDFSSDSFYGSLTDMSKKLDTLSQGMAGMTGGPQLASGMLDAYGKLSHMNDKIAFEMIQNYFKMDTFMREVQKQTQVGWNQHLRQPDKFDPPDVSKIKKGVASYVNDLFGGENYYQIVQDSNNWFMKNVKSELLTPSMRRKLLQRLEYAPDWTLSVIRSFTQAVPGLSDSSLGGKLHRRFLLGLGAMTFTVANMINHYNTGKYIWQNGNPGYIDLGNGYRMQWDKQLSELTDAMQDPAKWTLNRVAAVPRLGVELLLNQQYLSRYKAPPIVPKGDHGFAALADVGAHVGAQYLPIAAHQAVETQSGRAEFNKQGLINAASSLVSFPIYKKPGYGGKSTQYNPEYIKELMKQYKPKKRSGS